LTYWLFASAIATARAVSRPATTSSRVGRTGTVGGGRTSAGDENEQQGCAATRRSAHRCPPALLPIVPIVATRSRSPGTRARVDGL
jgi:hypothetical protein